MLFVPLPFPKCTKMVHTRQHCYEDDPLRQAGGLVEGDISAYFRLVHIGIPAQSQPLHLVATFLLVGTEQRRFSVELHHPLARGGLFHALIVIDCGLCEVRGMVERREPFFFQLSSAEVEVCEVRHVRRLCDGCGPFITDVIVREVKVREIGHMRGLCDGFGSFAVNSSV